MSRAGGSDHPPDGDDVLFAAIAANILAQGFSVHAAGMPAELLGRLRDHALSMPAADFKRAGVGRDGGHALKDAVRTDEVCWIDEGTALGQAWLCWIAALQLFLNRRLFLGLLSFESHFAHYTPGNFYKKHRDAFKGDANRVLSLILYLNPRWQAADGGELLLQVGDAAGDTLCVPPACGTLVIFLSEDFPHEVLTAHKDRYSIAGWFRARNG